jgi:Uma2 family endonuclease
MTTTANIRTGTRMTLAEFLELPRMEQRCELLDGVVYMAAFPIPDHQFSATVLGSYLFQQITETGLGVVFQVAGVVVSANSALGPDIVVVRAERVGIIGPTVIDGGPPDIVVEVLSSNRHIDLGRKRARYEAAGISEYWILDGDADTLTALELNEDGVYRERAVLTSADTLTTPLFPDFSLPMARLFEHPARVRRE